ncbi:hypothetical protein M427DRAFT_100050 [Gonapodya prolifera JEL478]|uniref:Cytosol aminopeptidase domain-containing protein n=1 Tax=Gonapodya prolifera (strain JEL478) TaxID=1344416 RepID=A0A139AAM7_GONPJ|nr:hypothetical protein M427DRAFT_100050 [Gonapodya prolifera JEL478]|eukprot:KXS13856.1 hypothetical protein M427DRAFT_100050 [Gonapodya prolifera JEL478]
MSAFTSGKFDALIIGAHTGGTSDLHISDSGTKLLSEPAKTHILNALASSRWKGKKGEARVVYGVKDIAGVDILTVVGLGKKTDDEIKRRETARSAVSPLICPKALQFPFKLLRHKIASGISSIRSLSSDTVFKIATEDLSSAFGAAEGTFLSQYSYDELKDPKSRSKPAEVELVAQAENAEAKEAWNRGKVYAEGQNLARRLAETPANFMTPTIFAEEVTKVFQSVPSVELTVRDKSWMEEKGMGSLLSVSQGSAQPPKIVEFHYKGGSSDTKPVLLVGKGVTFDSGGISLKPAADMAAMRGRCDMGGAAITAGLLYSAAKLKLPINIIGIVGLTENMPSGTATKPGDVFKAMNGITIEVDNTDAEGRLVLADCLYYGCTTYSPRVCIDFATLTGAMMIALGDVYTGVFSTSDDLWARLNKAGKMSGDPLWRMPFDGEYKKQMKSATADIKNVGGRPGGACTAAIFLREFIPGLPKEGDDDATANGGSEPIQYAHFDVAGVMQTTSVGTRLKTRLRCMSGRPLRSVLDFLRTGA